MADKLPAFIDPASNVDAEPIQTPKEKAQLRATQAGAASSEVNTEESLIRLKYLEAQLKAAAEKAQADAEKARLDRETLTEGQGKAANFYRRTAAANQVFDKLKLDPDSFLNVAFRAAAPGLQSHLSSDERNLARDAITNFLSATLRLESGAAIGPSEFIKQYQIYFPSSGAGPKEIAEKKRLRDLAIRGFASEAGPVGIQQANKDLVDLGYVPPKTVAAPPAVAIGGPGGPGEGATPPPAVAGLDAKSSAQEIPPEVTEAVTAFVQQKRAAGEQVTPDELAATVSAAMQRYGYPGKALPEGAKAAAEAINAGGAFGGIAPAEKPISNTEAMWHRALLQPESGAVAGAVQGLSAGLLPKTIGLFDPEAGAAAQRTATAARTDNPAFVAGEIAGSVLGAGKLAKAVAPMADAAGLSAGAGNAAANIAFGTAQGAGNAPAGQELSGAATGAILSAAGEAIPAGVGRVARPNTPEEVAFLRSKGVSLTPGTTLGGRAARLEEVGSKLLLGGGDVALAARRKAFDDFQRKYLDEGLSNIGAGLPKKGLDPKGRMRAAREAFGRAYDDVRSKLNFNPADPDTLTQVGDFETKLTSDAFAPENAMRLQKLLDGQVKRKALSPTVSGKEYKEVSSLLGKRRAAFERAQNWELVDGVDELQGILDANVRRNSAPEVVQQLDDTDRGFALFARAQEAGRMAGNEGGMFSPSQLLSVERRGDTSVRGRSYNEGEGLAQKWGEAGQKVLGNVEPDSGTATRLQMGAPLTGASYFDPTGAGFAANAALGLSNAPGIKQAITAAIAGKRPKPIDTFGDLVQKYQQPIGATTGAALREWEAPTDKKPVRFMPAVEDFPAEAPPPTAAPEASLDVGGRRVRYDPATKMFVDEKTGETAASLLDFMQPVAKARGGRVKAARSRSELIARYAGSR